MKKTVIASLAFLLYAFSQTIAAETFTVADIRIDGLQRVSAATVFRALPIEVGQEVDREIIARSIRELYDTGKFHDVRLERDGDVIIVTLSERPTISKIEIDGNKSIETEDLLDGLAQADLSEGSVFQRATLDKIKLDLERQYIAQGRYGARVTTEVKPQPRNRVVLNINIYEGEVASIKNINLVGNDVFNDEELLGLFELRTRPWWALFSSRDKYAREKLSGDLENLRSYYMDRGYINFQIESTQVSVTPSKEHVYITVNLSEGEVYTVNDVKLAGDLPVAEILLKSLLVVRKGQTFSRQLVTVTSDLITKRLGNEGYTFAEINGVPEVNEEDKTVDVTFFVNPGKRVYVRRINFKGNEKTSDEVMRREMRQMEGAWASGHKIERSKARLERLGFFRGVNVDTPRVPGTDDQIDVDFAVEEQPSGSIGASVGYQDGTGLVFGANVSQSNFLGTGNKVSFAINRTDLRNSYNFSFLNPYYTVDGVSRGYSLFFTETDYSNSNTTSFRTDVWGANVTYGYPINENERLAFTLGFDNAEVFSFISSKQPIKDFVDYEIGGSPTQSRDVFSYTVSASWTRSTLNKGIFADRGASQRLGIEIAVPGSDLEYFKITHRAERYFPLTKIWTLRLRSELGYGDGYADVDALPFYKHYYAGGFGSVRGYDDRTLGPTDIFQSQLDDIPQELSYEQAVINNSLTLAAQLQELGEPIFSEEDPTVIVGYERTEAYEEFEAQVVADEQEAYVNGGRDAVIESVKRTADPFGGNLLVEGSAEFIFPAPFAKDKRSLRTLFFIDGGNVFDTNRRDENEELEINARNLRYSAGVGLSWLTAIGPLTFTYAKTINDQPGDDTRSFQFSLGQSL